MLGISSLPVIRVNVRYPRPCEAQERLPVGEEVERVVRQPPSWEVVKVADWGEKNGLSVRLSESDSSRPNIQLMFEWLLRKGARPAVFCEAAAVRQAMGTDCENRNVVCLGTLWKVGDDYCYVCWQNGEMGLYPTGHSFGPDFMCPMVLNGTHSLNPLPEVEG